MAQTYAKGMEIPTIDCVLVTIQVGEATAELALDTASKVAVEVVTETTEAKKLIVKGILKAQKRAKTTVTGNKITLTDNLFIPQLVDILQGGTITKDAGGVITGYAPPVVGSTDTGDVFTLNCYSAIYSAAGVITGYEKIAYPNCTGDPIAFSVEDNVFRAPEYVINSMPDTGDAPYSITYITALPTVSAYVPAV